jgi:type II secretory pathway component PulF
MTIAGWRRTALLHGQLAGLLDAGLPIGRSLVLAGATAGGRMAAASAAWAASCEGGNRLWQVLGASGEAPLVVALVRAGEESGRLPDCCRRIADICERLARTRDEAVGRLIYPALLLHAALIAPAVPGAVLGRSDPLWLLAGPACLWGLIAALAAVGWGTGRSGLFGRLMLRRPFSFLAMPMLVANTAAVLEAAFSAGMRVQAAFALAAGACGNQAMGARLAEAGVAIEERRLDSVAEGLAHGGVGGDLLALVQTGEAGGRLDRALAQVATLAEERFASRLRWTAKIATGTVYAIAMITAACTVLMMWSQAMGGAMTMADEALGGG